MEGAYTGVNGPGMKSSLDPNEWIFFFLKTLKVESGGDVGEKDNENNLVAWQQNVRMFNDAWIMDLQVLAPCLNGTALNDLDHWNLSMACWIDIWRS